MIPIKRQLRFEMSRAKGNPFWIDWYRLRWREMLECLNGNLVSSEELVVLIFWETGETVRKRSPKQQWTIIEFALSCRIGEDRSHKEIVDKSWCALMLERSTCSGTRRDKRERMHVMLPGKWPGRMASLILIGQNVPVEFQRPTNSHARQCIWKCKSPRDLTVDWRTTEN